MVSYFRSGERLVEFTHVKPQRHPAANLVKVVGYLIGGNGQRLPPVRVCPEVL